MSTRNQMILLLFAAVVVACGGGTSSNDGSTTSDGTSVDGTVVGTDPSADSGQTNPFESASNLSVDAGYARVAAPGATVQLNATVESDIGASIEWTQVEGTAVTLDDPYAEDPSFVTPAVEYTETLVFEIRADDGVSTPATDRVSVEVWVAADDLADSTAIGNFTDRSGWQCDVDPPVDPEMEMTVSDDVITFDSNGIPAHATGTFPNAGNPNTIGTVYTSYDVPLVPEQTDIATEMDEFGVTLQGIKLERDTAESYQNAGEWRYEAITPGLANGATSGAEFRWLGTDCNNAHVQPTGAYHYHGMPEALINQLGEKAEAPKDMILGGYAADGFPFYLRYGYADPNDPESDLVPMQASWELKTGTRSSGPGGAYDGTFREDWEYVEGSGDLDECGGRFGVTPEYPEGTYHYYLTDDYPYIPRCVFGVPDPSFRTLGSPP